MPETPPTAAAIVARCEEVMAHAWMVRTFVKHSEEAEDYLELLNMARTVFDAARALESRADDPAGYLHMLGKKLSRMKRAAAEFREQAPQASTHMNFRQAVVSLDACMAELERLLHRGNELVGGPSPGESPAAGNGNPLHS